MRSGIHRDRRRYAARPGGSPGFTLVELLVVVSIIALLIAILLPSLRKARDQSKDVSCKANLHSMGQAFTMYAEKYGGVWPSAVDSMGQQNRWPVPFHKGGIVKADFNAYNSSGGLTRRGGPSIFLCPAEKADRTIPNWTNESSGPHSVDRAEVGGSFSYSAEVHRDGETLRVGNTTTPPFVRKVDTCRRPGSVFSVLDNVTPLVSTSTKGWRFYREGGEGFFMGYRDYTGKDLGETQKQYRVIGNRHSGRANGLCIDTHVEGIRPEKMRYDQVSWTAFQWKDNLRPPGGQ